MGAAHLLQSSFTTMPASSSLSSSLPTNSFMAKGTGRGLQNFGFTPSFMCKCALNEFIVPSLSRSSDVDQIRNEWRGV